MVNYHYLFLHKVKHLRINLNIKDSEIFRIFFRQLSVYYLTLCHLNLWLHCFSSFLQTHRKSPARQPHEEKKPYISSSPQDPLRRNYTSSGVTSSSELNYSTGSTTTTWGQGRPLPVPYLDDDISKRFSGDYPGEETLRRIGEHQLTMQGTKTRSSHVYESPKFNRRDICTENEFDPSPVHYP